MTMTSSQVARKASLDLYRAVWRWHFYAGLFVLPFLITLSLTGALYLFDDELDALIHSDLKRVEAQQDLQPPATLVSAALQAHPRTAVKYTSPTTPESSAEITVNALSGERLAVYVNPYTANVLGSLDDRGTVMWTVRYLHSFKFFRANAAQADRDGRGLVDLAGRHGYLSVVATQRQRRRGARARQA